TVRAGADREDGRPARVEDAGKRVGEARIGIVNPKRRKPSDVAADDPDLRIGRRRAVVVPADTALGYLPEPARRVCRDARRETGCLIRNDDVDPGGSLLDAYVRPWPRTDEVHVGALKLVSRCRDEPDRRLAVHRRRARIERLLGGRALREVDAAG